LQSLLSVVGWALFALVTALYGAKLLWNALIPLEMARRLASSSAESARGISFLPFVDVALWGATGGAAWLRSAAPPWDARSVLLYGGAALFLSYAALVCGAFWVQRRAKKRALAPPPKEPNNKAQS
jgi:hypothetical protein